MVEIRMKNMDKNRYFQIRSEKYIKTKVADIQRLYSKWFELVMVVYKPSFAKKEIHIQQGQFASISSMQ